MYFDRQVARGHVVSLLTQQKPSSQSAADADDDATSTLDTTAAETGFKIINCCVKLLFFLSSFVHDFVLVLVLLLVKFLCELLLGQQLRTKDVMKNKIK